jgi:DNA polymerase III subunit delta'
VSFKAVKGQEKVIALLQGYLELSRLQGGYLFIGPQGIGKRLVAVKLAQAANCLEGGVDPCGACSSCRKIKANQHPDIHIIENTDPEIKIEQIRELKREISLRPYEGRIKFFIIDNAHTLTAEGSNALLKVLEEPTKDTVLILITDKPALLFKTILSRCKPLRFSPLPRQELQRILQVDYGVPDHEAHCLAYFSEGSLGLSLRLRASGFFEEKNKVIDELALGKTVSGSAVASGERADIKRYFNLLASWYRDLYFLKTGSAHGELIHEDRLKDLVHAQSKFSFKDLEMVSKFITDSIRNIDSNVNTKLLMSAQGAHIWKD